MPFGMFEDLGMRGKVALAFVGLALVWVGIQTGLVEAVLALGLSSPTVLGLVVLALIAYWAFDELEDDDGATDVISKTSDRAESASKGFLDGTAALIMGGIAVLSTIGVELFDGLAALVDVAMTAPMATAQVGTGIAGIAGAAGVLATTEVAAAAALLLVAAFVARKNKTEG